MLSPLRDPADRRGSSGGRSEDPSAGPDRRRRRALALLDLGHHLGAEGRPAHRPVVDRRGHGPRGSDRAQGRRHRLDRLPVRAHRRARLSRDAAALRHAGRAARRLLHPGLARGLPACRRHDHRRQHRPLSDAAAGAAKAPGQKLVPSLRRLAGGGAPMPPEVYWQVKRVARHGNPPRLRHDRVPDDHERPLRRCRTSSSRTPKARRSSAARSRSKTATGSGCSRTWTAR